MKHFNYYNILKSQNFINFTNLTCEGKISVPGGNVCRLYPKCWFFGYLKIPSVLGDQKVLPI